MEKTKIERHIDVVNSITRLEELMVENTIADELVGHTIIIDAGKVMEFIQTMKSKMTDNFRGELKRRDPYYEPLRVAVNVMNNGWRTRNTNAPKPEDGDREINMGETRKHAPFGGIKLDED